MANQGASSSSAPFTKSWKYHVFLSFRGFDTRSNFTSHLYSALRREGINTFMDDDELRRGEEISNALLTAIEDSKISVVVFSENYASSKWCLDELVKILDCKESNQQLVIPVFYKVNPSDVRNQRGSFRDALANMDCNNLEKVNRWKEALSQAGKLAGFTLSDEYRSEAELIHKIVQDISQQVRDRTYLYVTEYPVRMCHPVEYILKLLDLGEKDVRMAGLWGTGGIGKTTIAKAVYNSIAHEFEGFCFLESVRECSMSHGGLAKLQKTLLFEILGGRKLKVTNVDKGVTMIKEWLRGRKVLLVLDDVDDMEQLHKLVGACDWFGVGSRIIITTRDKQLLTAHHVNLIHEVKILDDPEALELFCWHAFKRSEPPLGDYVKLAERAIRYAQGLPLALKVLGSCLCGGSTDKWEAALNGFKSTKIQDVLKISSDALDDDGVKEVFLDIACFFKGRNKKRVTELLVACGLNAGYGIEVLIEKALISVKLDYIEMHDLLEEMGKDIVEQESPTEAGGRSRLWSHENIEHVLANNTHFTKLTSLNFTGSLFLTEIPDLSSSQNLRSLNANGCTSLVKVHPSVGYLDRLEVLSFCHCHKLRKFPNKVRLKSLKKFHLFGCIKLKSFPEIVDKMESLNELDLGVTGIRELPASIGHLIRLKELGLRGSAIKELPSSVGNLTALQILGLGGSAIEELPSSIGNLTKLLRLDLCKCENLANLPQSIYELQNLLFINLDGCPKLVTLPNNLISEVLSSAESLPLKVRTKAYISYGRCSLDFKECNVSDIDSLENFCWWSNLRKINLSQSNFVRLPVCISKCVNLRELYLSGCKKLVEILGELPASIERISMADCISLERFSTLSKILEDGDMQLIKFMNLSNCHGLCDNLGLDVSNMAKLFNEVKRSKGIEVKLSGNEVPEWFTFRNYFNDHVRDYDDDDCTNYELPIEIPRTSVLENTELVLCAVWEITESFVDICFLRFYMSNYFQKSDWHISQGETRAGNVWLKCVPLMLNDESTPPIFRVVVYGGGLRIKSIGAHLAHISMDGKHN
ncbi:hypothetical protein PRUPE_1G162500 [Prunus persica]|uniref:TIR domain-containing protein n=1 Tax=Prunus persica TaxID=3760 RepID=A0A251QYL8_PRUPE|nr:hypothetical protein PRUPE_1G162500 [Prunus persica]